MIGKKLLILVVSGSIALAGAVGFSLTRQVEGPDPLDLVSGRKNVLELKLYGAAQDAKTGKSVSGMSSGRDIRSADGSKLLQSHNVWEDGSYEEIFYRQDESKQWSRDYYPLLAGEELAVLRSIAHFAADGKTYTSHDVKRRDGTQERLGKLLEDGNYEQTYFCPDGKTAQKVQLFDKNKRFQSEKAIFCQTGKAIRETAEGKYGAKILKLFNPDGKVKTRIEMNDGGEHGAYYTGEVFGENGEVLFSFSTGGFGSNTKLLKNGKLQRELQVNSYMSYSEEVTIYDDAGKELKLFRQEWQQVENWKPEKGTWLKSIKEFAADGTTIKREIEFDKESRKPVKMTLRPSSGVELICTLDQDGKIVKAERKENGKTAEAPLPAETTLRVKESWTRTYQFPKLPEWDDGQTATSEKVYDFR